LILELILTIKLCAENSDKSSKQGVKSTLYRAVTHPRLAINIHVKIELRYILVKNIFKGLPNLKILWFMIGNIKPKINIGAVYNIPKIGSTWKSLEVNALADNSRFLILDVTKGNCLTKLIGPTR